jgi:ankyrin repeat protein
VLLNYVQAMLKAGTAGKKNGEDTIETVHHLLESRKDGNCTKVAEILITAAAKGDTDMLNLLLHYGANKNRVRADGSTPLLIAAEKGHVQIVSMLLEAGACRETAANDGYTPLAISAMNGHDRTTRLLLEAGADRSKARADGYTPLMIAALGGRGEIAKVCAPWTGPVYPFLCVFTS